MVKGRPISCIQAFRACRPASAICSSVISLLWIFHTFLAKRTNHGDTLLYACNPMPKDYVYRIPHEENSIRFSFVMPEYTRPKEIVYSYWLEGYDKGWSVPQTIGEKEYTKLPKGDYAFHLRATNRITGVSDEQCINIHIEPAWYETWWAYTLYFIIAILAAWQLIQWMKRIEKRKLRELEAKKEKEMRQKEERFQLEQERKEMKLREQEARLEVEEQRRKHEVALLQRELQPGIRQLHETSHRPVPRPEDERPQTMRIPPHGTLVQGDGLTA